MEYQHIKGTPKVYRKRQRAADIIFVIALFIGTGAVDYMLDNPAALAIAAASLLIIVRYTLKAGESGGRR